MILEQAVPDEVIYAFHFLTPKKRTIWMKNKKTPFCELA